ncbi:MAG: hypothetical protein NTV05_08420 [Acidobacteria bacterium]|nr:hypothetical protein [Acidobacteriota bacterium]
MKKDPHAELALKAARAVRDWQQHVQMVGFYHARKEEAVRKLLTAMNVELPEHDLWEFEERFFHHLRVAGGAHLSHYSTFNSFVNREHGQQVMEAATHALKEMGHPVALAL